MQPHAHGIRKPQGTKNAQVLAIHVRFTPTTLRSLLANLSAARQRFLAYYVACARTLLGQYRGTAPEQGLFLQDPQRPYKGSARRSAAASSLTVA